jgi:hypothetical protein
MASHHQKLGPSQMRGIRRTRNGRAKEPSQANQTMPGSGGPSRIRPVASNTDEDEDDNDIGFGSYEDVMDQEDPGRCLSPYRIIILRPELTTCADLSEFIPRKRPRHNPITTVDWKGEICQLLNLPLETPNKAILVALEDASEKLQEVEHLRSLASSVKGPPRYQVLHEINCSQYKGESLLYLQEPSVEEYGPLNAHLRGRGVIHNLELFLERNKDVVFLVRRQYICCSGTLPRSEIFQPEGEQDRDPSAFVNSESVSYLAPKLKSALSNIAEIALDGIPHPSFGDLRFGNEAIRYPYLWWFHRQEEIEIAISDLGDEFRRQLDVFRGYLQDCLQKEWQSVLELTSRNKIKAKYLDYLFVSTILEYLVTFD